MPIAKPNVMAISLIDEQYNANRLTEILTETCSIIGANVLNIARDYEPQGASVTILVSEEPINPQDIDNSEHPGPLPSSVVAHLDKSHICVHTIRRVTRKAVYVPSAPTLKSRPAA